MQLFHFQHVCSVVTRRSRIWPHGGYTTTKSVSLVRSKQLNVDHIVLFFLQSLLGDGAGVSLDNLYLPKLQIVARKGCRSVDLGDYSLRYKNLYICSWFTCRLCTGQPPFSLHVKISLSIVGTHISIKQVRTEIVNVHARTSYQSFRSPCTWFRGS